MLSCSCYMCLKVSCETLWNILLMHTVIIFLFVLLDIQIYFTLICGLCGIYVILVISHKFCLT